MNKKYYTMGQKAAVKDVYNTQETAPTDDEYESALSMVQDLIRTNYSVKQEIYQKHVDLWKSKSEKELNDLLSFLNTYPEFAKMINDISVVDFPHKKPTIESLTLYPEYAKGFLNVLKERLE